MAKASVKSHTALTVGMAPPEAIGTTQIWWPNGQLPITDGQATILVMMGKIVYSPEDGPGARVYRLREGVTIRQVKAMLK